MTAYYVVAAAIGVAFVIGYLALRRHYTRTELLWAGGGYVLFFGGLAVAFQMGTFAPLLFLVGGIAGAMIQHAFDEEKHRRTRGRSDRPATETAIDQADRAVAGPPGAG